MSMRRRTKQTDLAGLEALALEQAGCFEREDARGHGIGDDLLHYYVRTGRFERLATARAFPVSDWEVWSFATVQA